MSESQTELLSHQNEPPGFPLNIFLAADHRLRATWRALVCIPIFIVCVIAAELVARALQPHSSSGFEIVNRFLAAALLSGALAVMWYAADGHEHFFQGIGLGFMRPWLREFSMGAGIGLSLIALCVVVIAGLGSYKPTSTQEPALRLTALLLAQFWTLLWGSLTEEMMFRGYPFQRMLEAWGAVPAICVSSLLFASIHLLNPHFAALPMVNTMLIGAVFAVLYLKTRSLWLPWGFHFGWNFALGVIFGLPVSGLYQFAVWNKALVAGPDWVTGGAYGIEASEMVFVLFTLCLVTAVAWKPVLAQKPLSPAAVDGIQPNQSS